VVRVEKKLGDYQSKTENIHENKNEIISLKEQLLKPHKNIRDAVHGDIRVTRPEADILDTRRFQRLHDLRQLGPTHLVYPSANHTRFDHSLGTLFMAEKLVYTINSSPHKDRVVDTYDHFIIRLCALLHDVCNLPFGHTLEDEGGLFARQWEDEQRIELMLGEKSEIGQVIVNNEILNKLFSLGDKQFEPRRILQEIQTTLRSIEEKKSRIASQAIYRRYCRKHFVC